MNYADNYKDCEWIKFELLEDFMKQCLMNIGVPEDDADIVTDVLMESDKRGIDSHGIGRLKREALARHKGHVELEVMHAIKRALDPKGILNPGRVLPG